MVELRSNFSPTSALGIARRAEWRPLGIDSSELEKPKVAIVNSSSDLAACFAHLDDIVPVLKEELRSLRALPFEIRTAAPSDFVTSVGRGGSYILSARNSRVNDVEGVVEGAQVVPIIAFGSCDTTPPARRMAGVRLPRPTVVIPSGYQQCGLAEGRSVDV